LKLKQFQEQAQELCRALVAINTSDTPEGDSLVDKRLRYIEKGEVNVSENAADAPVKAKQCSFQ
jgi:hypothetical protein